MKPLAQVHVYDETPFVQVAPFLHGAEAQLSIKVAQVVPVYPAAQVHLYAPPGQLTHVAPFLHGADEHPLLEVLHVGPLNPGLHLQINDPTIPIQVPPFWHGAD